MSSTIQTILAFLALALAIGFLIRKFFFKKPISNKGCGQDDCGCQ